MHSEGQIETNPSNPGSFFSTIAWRILSFPIFLKIMGIGFLTAILFGSVTLVQTRIGTSYILVQLLEEKVLDMSEMLAGTIEEQARSGNIPAISRDLNRARNIYTDMLYAIVTSPEGKILASTNRDEIPGDILNDTGPACPPDCATRTFKYGKGSIFEARIPISGNMVGVLRVGFTDDSITRQKRSFTGTVLWGLFLCITIGACLALLLTNILTRPLHHLVESANQIREGKFETRADIYSNDEVGRLAVAFNQMSEALNRYQKEVQAKEKARLSLIERIVQVQEDERKSISRELHDHLGQSLTSLLLQVQSIRKQENPPDNAYMKVEKSIRQVIDEIHRLAWGMRPSILDDYGLDSALARHIEEVSQHADMEIDYNYSSPPDEERLPSRIEVCMFRIAQEAITNIQRHSGASHASVVVLRQAHEITMLVEDNGNGFHLSMLKEKRDKCLGLIGMKERVALLGGDVDIESTSGDGTTVRVRIPLDGVSNASANMDSR